MMAGQRSHSVVVEADGGSRGNPGPAGYGAVVFDAGTYAVLAERREALGVTTNNVAEYRGLIAGLQAAHDLGASRVHVRMDSKLVVEQMKGSWQVKNEGLRPLHRQAAQLKLGFAEITFNWIPREQNKHADRLANEAMDEAAGARVGIARTPTSAAATASRPAWTPPSGPRTTLVLVRHGATVHSKDRRFSGPNDLPLDDVGLAQAAALAKRDFGQVAAIVSSPVRRAVETAQVIGQSLGLGVALDAGFAEVDFGAFEGLTAGDVRLRFPAELAAWTASADAAPPGGESFAALAARLRVARESLVADYPDALVVIVTHVSPIKTLVGAALEAPLTSMYRMHLDTASVSIVDYRADGTASLRLFNDTSHLD